MTEKECSQSLNGKHQYKMIKRGLNPVYECRFCMKTRPKTITCPNCGHHIETDEGNIWDHI